MWLQLEFGIAEGGPCPFQIIFGVDAEATILCGEDFYLISVFENTELFQGFRLFKSTLFKKDKLFEKRPFKTVNTDMFIEGRPLLPPDKGDGGP